MEYCNSLIYNGDLKLHSTQNKWGCCEYLEEPTTVTVLVVEKQPTPHNDLLHFCMSYRVGSSKGPTKCETLEVLPYGVCDGTKIETEVAYEIAKESFGVKGHVYKLGNFYNNPINSTAITAMYWVDAQEVEYEHEGVHPTWTLEQAFNMAKSPYKLMDSALIQSILLYASQRGL